MRLAITGGGTGGHLAIARALGQECQKLGFTTFYIGSTRGQDRQWFENESAPFHDKIFLESVPVVNQSFFGKWRALAQNIAQSSKARKILREQKIEACISVGGFSAATGSFGAISCGIPFFIHEQNACMGSLNRLLKPFAKKFYASFEFSNTTIMPYPIHENFFNTQRVRTNLHTLAFLGGSQGAQAINSLAISLAPLLQQKQIKILHQTGKTQFNAICEEYGRLGLRLATSLEELRGGGYDAFAFDFSTQMADIMNLADFCVSRSGASSLWEIVANGLPSLFIPYPYAAKNHQYFNAKNLVEKGLALLHTQDDLARLKPQDILATIEQVELEPTSQALLCESKPNGARAILEDMAQTLRL